MAPVLYTHITRLYPSLPLMYVHHCAITRGLTFSLWPAFCSVDAIDESRYNSALQQVNQMLKRNPNVVPAQVRTACQELYSIITLAPPLSLSPTAFSLHLYFRFRPPFSKAHPSWLSDSVFKL